MKEFIILEILGLVILFVVTTIAFIYFMNLIKEYNRKIKELNKELEFYDQQIKYYIKQLEEHDIEAGE